MTSVVAGSDEIVFSSKSEIVDRILANVMANQKQQAGTEVEMFLVQQGDKSPITISDGQEMFEHLSVAFAEVGCKPTLRYETMVDGTRSIVGLDIEDVGTISLEAGHQFEFASVPCDPKGKGIYKKNKLALDIIRAVAQEQGYNVVFMGHMPNYAGNAEGVNRSRGREWRRYYDKRFGEDALTLRELQDGTGSTQFTFDSGGENFHEYLKAALLVEPAFAIRFANSDRNYIIKQYGDFLPAPVKPLTQLWEAKTPREALEIIVDRLMEIEIPFLPDSSRPGSYRAAPLAIPLPEGQQADGRTHRPANVGELMAAGKLTEKVLYNVGGFFYTWPAFRNFRAALIETRGIDSVGSPETIAEIAERHCILIYDDEVRRKLLADYGHLSIEQIAALHKAAFLRETQNALATTVNGFIVANYVDDIMERSTPTSWTREFAASAREVGGPTPPARAPFPPRGRRSRPDRPSLLAARGEARPAPDSPRQ